MKQFVVTGMSCAACSARVEKAVNELDGVKECSVSLLTNSMGVEGDVSDEEIIEAITKAGYGAKVKGQEETSSTSMLEAEKDALIDRETPKLKRRLKISVGFLLVLMYFSMGYNMWNFPVPSFFDGNYMALTILQLLLTIVVLVINRKFFINGFGALKHKASNMDTLVALGSSASFGWSLYILFKMTTITDLTELHMIYHSELYFESAAMIPTLITIGKMLEAKSKGKTTNALKGLMNLAPKTAVLLKDGNEVEVSVEEVQIGDHFVVKPGDSIPVDGTIVEGHSAIDESSLTGESIPVDKQVGDEVSAATMNQSGYIECVATHVGEDTTLAHIIKMVSDASSTKAPIARIADKVSGIFVPTVISIALVTMIIWLIKGYDIGFALARGISVLVISCPCALGLATPVAIMVANGVGAKHGVLFKTGAALENAGKVDIVALDKTGTITSGNPVVTDVLSNTLSDDELLKFAASLELKSEHPLAKAIVNKLNELGLKADPMDEFEVLVGNGVKGMLDGKECYAGKLEFIQTHAIMDQMYVDQAKTLAESGKTPLFFSKDGEVVGLIGVADVIREDSKQAIHELKNMGIKVVMITGDNEKTANAIGKVAGVDHVIAGVLPDGKEEAIKALQTQGMVAMVGDGINDAPALTRADIGIAIGAGTDVAIDAAEIVLMKSNLSDVAASIRLSRKTVLNIHENLFWAFFYNAICIPLAAGVTAWKMNPMVGAAAMSLSSVTVVSNALRLNGVRVYDASKDKPLKKKEEVDLTKIPQLQTKQQEPVVLHVEGMMCEHCENAAMKAVKKIDGVSDVKANHKTGIVEVFETKSVDLNKIKQAIEEEDYKVIDNKEVVFTVDGMMCEHCEASVEKAISKLDGVISVKADHKQGTVVIQESKEIDPNLIKQAIEDEDYEVK